MLLKLRARDLLPERILHSRFSWNTACWGVLILGVLLRFFYMLATPAVVRSYDTDGHREYITYVADHRALPPPDGGWEFYQPPLAYVIAAPIVTLGRALEWSTESVDRALQMQSFLFASIAFAIAAWIGRLLFRGKAKPWASVFALILALIPGFVMFSSRISNDVLLSTLSFLAIALMVRVWQHGSRRNWVILAIILSLALLTKASALLLIGAAGVLLLLERKTSWNEKAFRIFLCGTIGLVLTGWFMIPRLMDKGVTRVALVGNIYSLNDALRVPNTPAVLLTFNPAQVLAHPFNDPWNDSERRQYFPEYFLRSAFFGEFAFPEARAIAIEILTSAMLLLISMFFGIYSSLRKNFREYLPLHLTFGFLIVGHMITRIAFPMGNTGDFRFSAPLLIPASFYLIFGLQSLPRPLRIFFLTILGIGLAACLLFLWQLILPFSNS